MSSPLSSLKKPTKNPLGASKRSVPFRASPLSEDDIIKHIDEIIKHGSAKDGAEETVAASRSRISQTSMRCTTTPSDLNDTQLMSSMMSRLAAVESQLTLAQHQLKEKDKKIKVLEEKCNLYQRVKGSSNNQVDDLNRKCRKLQNHVHEIETFLEDYGMIWVGGDLSSDEEDDEDYIDVKDQVQPASNSSYTSIQQSEPVWSPGSSIRGCGFYVDYDLILKNIEELNLIAGEGEHEIKRTGGGAKLQVKEPIPLTLYANGIFMFGGPFRLYTDPQTQACIKDIMDGYFPTELQSRYPDGVPFKAKDMRDTAFRDQRREELFPGKGKVLLENSTKVLPTIPTTPLAENRYRGAGLPDRQRSPATIKINENPNVSHAEEKLSTMPSIKETFKNPERHIISREQFLKRLPNSVVKQGKIIDIRSDIATNLNELQSANDVIIIETKTVKEMKERMATGIKKRPPTPSNIATLRIRSETGNQIYILKMKFQETIGQVYYYIDKQRLPGSPAYQLKTTFPSITYNDHENTLFDCKLIPNATLVIVPQKSCENKVV